MLFQILLEGIHSLNIYFPGVPIKKIQVFIIFYECDVSAYVYK